MNENRLGQVYAVLAFLFWGAIAPIYFKQVSSVEPLEVLIHRIFWSFIILIPLLFITKQVDIFKIIIKDVKKLKYLAFSTFFISLNWLVFIWAVTNERIMETAFGYYINPLVSVFLGYVFFGERMTRYQNFAILIAFLAVLYQLISLGSLPLVSLTLALSFAFYGMIRKKINVGSIVGLFIETLILMSSTITSPKTLPYFPLESLSFDLKTTFFPLSNCLSYHKSPLQTLHHIQGSHQY
mgnify:CR=1 FL=1